MALLRRALFRGAAAALASRLASPSRAGAAQAAFEVREIRAPGRHASVANLLVPAHLRPSDNVRLLVALHGLGESHDPELGIRAWLDLYGLRTSYTRLLTPPIVRTSRRKDWTDGRLAEVNAMLEKSPFAGIAVLCPFTPNLRRLPNRDTAVREYGEWIVSSLLPLAREQAQVGEGPSWTAIDGCSMGGPIALDVFVAHADVFGALGLVQGALASHRAEAHARAVAGAVKKHGARDVHVLSSEGDPFADAARSLSRELGRAGVAHTLRIPPGPHDQPWLRETGTIEMLLWHERRPRPAP